MKRLTLLGLLLVRWSWCEPIRVKFPVTPADASLFRVASGREVRLPYANGVLTIETYGNLEDARKLIVRREGYQDQAKDYTCRQLLNLPKDSSGLRIYPDVVLIPQGSHLYLQLARQKHWIFLGSLAVAAWMWRRSQESRQKTERLAQIERYTQTEGGDPMVGRRLDQYLITHKLGSGGMAAVYRAIPYDSLDETQAVALKLILDESRDPEFFHRFRREVEVTKSLNHPNTLRLFGWGEQDGLFFLVMELVEGKPLRTPPGGFSLSQFRAYLPGLMAGLLYAHDQGIVHRDLKPDNLMVMANGQIKVMDFGLARSHEMKTVTATGTALGTPAYMPPEQILGESPTPLSDQYSLGVTFYEMLCGRRPFEYEELMALIQAQLQEEAMPPSLYREDIPLELEQVVMQMLCKDPARRFRDLREVQRALDEAFSAPS